MLFKHLLFAASLFYAPIVSGSDFKREPSFNGTLSLNNVGELFTFDYTTSDPFQSNWIALYSSSGGGPVNQTYVSPSLTWQYAPESSGSVRLDPQALSPGPYQAYFLARDGYKWLSAPINVTVPSPPTDLSFPVSSATLRNARQWEGYSARIDGMLLGKGDESVTFSKLSGESWISVSSDGIISGTPGFFAPARSKVAIRSVASGGSTATIQLSIPVRRVYQRLVQELNVMSYNLWVGGTRVSNYQEKQMRFILSSNADIIALQESNGVHAARLGRALGWDFYQSSGSYGVISRYPIEENYGEISTSSGVRVSLSGNRRLFVDELNVWSVHLTAYPYGPYGFCFDNMTRDEVTALESEAGRTGQVTTILEGIASQLRNSRRVPVIVAGDFNAPSHLDYVPALQEKNCGIDGFDWPTSTLPADRGLIDSFRVAHPKPETNQGLTWSPVYPFNEGSTGPREPQDRIDFVYHTRERLRVLSSEKVVVGEPSPVPGHGENEWTSDHAAVLTRYSLN